MLTQEELNSLDSLLDVKLAPIQKIYSTLAEHGSQFKEINSTLAEHSSQFKEINSTLAELVYSVEEIRTTVNVLAGWADKTSHKVRIPL